MKGANISEASPWPQREVTRPVTKLLSLIRLHPNLHPFTNPWISGREQTLKVCWSRNGSAWPLTSVKPSFICSLVHSAGLGAKPEDCHTLQTSSIWLTSVFTQRVPVCGRELLSFHQLSNNDSKPFSDVQTLSPPFQFPVVVIYFVCQNLWFTSDYLL